MNNQSLIFLNRLKNASMMRQESITVVSTAFLLTFLMLLYKEGLIQSFLVTSNRKYVTISLRYSCNKSTFKSLKSFTRVAVAYNLTYREICKLSTKKFISIFSTDNGLMTGISCKQKRLGGRLYFIC